MGTKKVRHIVVIEDDRATNDKLKSLLETMPDVKVRQAYSRIEAAQYLTSDEIDLFVVDVELGSGPRDKHAGIKILSDLNSMHKATIVVSGMPEASILQSIALSLSAYDFIEKPINDLDFISKVERALAWKPEENTIRSGGPASWPSGLEPDTSKKFGVTWKRKRVALTMTELRIVHALAEMHERTVDHATLRKALVSAHSAGTLATHVAGVRAKFRQIDLGFSCIKTEPGKGYAWKTKE